MNTSFLQQILKKNVLHVRSNFFIVLFLRNISVPYRSLTDEYTAPVHLECLEKANVIREVNEKRKYGCMSEFMYNRQMKALHDSTSSQCVSQCNTE